MPTEFYCGVGSKRYDQKNQHPEYFLEIYDFFLV